jgi:very-short-patch-repair endonuclease
MNKPKKWTLEKLQKEASKYTRRVDFQNNSTGAYLSARRQNLLDFLCTHMQDSATKPYTDEEIIEIAKRFKTRSEFAKKSKAYSAAFLRGKDFVDSVCAHMTSVKKIQKHTKETARIDALKYQTKREWCIKDAGSYLASLKNGWIEDLCKHMKNKKRPAPTFEEVKSAALLYNSRGEWDFKDSRTYNQARKINCLDQVCQHMLGGGRSGPESEILKMIKTKFPSAMSKIFKNKDPRFPLKRYELDFYIPELKLGVEFDGKYWHSFEVLSKRKNLTKQQAFTYHEDKDNFFKTLGIRVFHIKEEEWFSNKDFVKQNLSHFLGFGTAMNRSRHARRQWQETIDLIKEELGDMDV